MADFLFGRTINLIVTAEGALPLSIDGFDPDKNAGFDIDAHIIKSTTRDANKGVIRIFNLPEDMRHAYQGRGVKVAVSAGHKLATNVATLGAYDVKKAYSTLDEADWVTHLEGGECQNALEDALITYSFSAGQTLSFIAKQVMQPLLAAGIGLGNFSTTLGTSQLTYPNGACGEGRARDRLYSLARKAGYEFSIQHGAFLFIKTGEADQTKIVNLSPSSGLIGVPAPGESDAKKGVKPQTKVKALLQPSIAPGSLINLDLPITFAVRGRMKVNKLDHNISTYAQPFYTEMECETV